MLVAVRPPRAAEKQQHSYRSMGTARNGTGNARLGQRPLHPRPIHHSNCLTSAEQAVNNTNFDNVALNANFITSAHDILYTLSQSKPVSLSHLRIYETCPRTTTVADLRPDKKHAWLGCLSPDLFQLRSPARADAAAQPLAG